MDFAELVSSNRTNSKFGVAPAGLEPELVLSLIFQKECQEPKSLPTRSPLLMIQLFTPGLDTDQQDLSASIYLPGYRTSTSTKTAKP